MNYKVINNAILNSRDLPKSFPRDEEFYDYLLANNVAFYYSMYLSKEKSIMDKKIIEVGKNLNKKFFNTLKLIIKICKDKKIKFLLFKTYKYIPEAVDNDIDLFVKKKDFYSFMKALEKENFSCIENEPLKGICKKEGFCIIEPRVTLSFRGVTILDEKKIWKKTEIVNIAEIGVLKASLEVDLLHLLLSILYNPNYLKLYLLLLYKKCDKNRLLLLCLDKRIQQDLNFVLNHLITKNIEEKRLPLFMGNIEFSNWWYRRILPISDLSLYKKLRHVFCFFYIKYLYLFLNKLAFQHQWPI